MWTKRQHWNSRGHFFAAAAEAMRRILVEQARRKRRLKHGGERGASISIQLARSPTAVADLLALDEALSKLAAIEPDEGGVGETPLLRRTDACPRPPPPSESLWPRPTGIWTFARSWLYAELADRSLTPFHTIRRFSEGFAGRLSHC